MPKLPYKPLVKIWHPWWLWEDYQNGFYSSVSKAEKVIGTGKYAEFLNQSKEFEMAGNRLINEWKYSCEQNLTQTTMNRIAYIGQAAMCIERGVSSLCRSGFMLLSPEDQHKANLVALGILNNWLSSNGYKPTDLKGAMR